MPKEHKDTPQIKVQIELSSYHIANLLAVLDLVPPAGEWHSDIINFIHKEMRAQGVDPDLFYFRPNPGLRIKDVKRHLKYLEYKEKQKKNGR